MDETKEPRERSANWGGRRTPAGGRPPTSDKVPVIQVRRVVDKIYRRYGGDWKMARVRNGKCIRAWMNPQTYGEISTVDGRPWWWEGLTEEALKEADFKYVTTEVVYFGVRTGKEYHHVDDGSWERAEDEGWEPVKGDVQIIE